jgi:queuine tRNA-ribosyltransferase
MPPSELCLPHGRITLPAFLPDATYGVVRSVDADDLERCGMEALVMSTFHLMQNPGSSTVNALGGLHRMASWRRPIVTDSGGFQAYSLIRENPRKGTMSSRGITFQPEGADRPFRLSPEKTVQLQLSYGSDVVVCLDDCRHPDEPESVQRESVERTIDWARRGRAEFDRLMRRPRRAAEQRPLLFAVIQGGTSRELRKRCADALLAIGFDGFGYGGWPLNSAGELLIDVVAYTRELVPRNIPMHALGIGHPENVMATARLGYEMFDSALPTRDARHGRLYSFVDPTKPISERSSGWFKYVYLQDSKHTKAAGPVFRSCPCYTCEHYALGYLHHLFANKDGLFMRLATIHNLTFMSQLMRRLGLRSNE